MCELGICDTKVCEVSVESSWYFAKSSAIIDVADVRFSVKAEGSMCDMAGASGHVIGIG